MLFQRALGREVSVGIIACVDVSYDAKRWWASSEGIRVTLSELFAYPYSLAFTRS